MPFYVGKGSGRRCFFHTWAAKNNYDTKNPRKDRTITNILKNELTPIIVLFDAPTEYDALQKEIHLISTIGRDKRINNKLIKGALTNLTNGGEPNLMNDPIVKEKVRLFHLGRKRSEDTKNKIRNSKIGTKLTDDHKQKITESLYGNCYAGKRVECTNILTKEKIIFPSVLQAAKALGFRWEIINKFISKGNKKGNTKGWVFKYI